MAVADTNGEEDILIENHLVNLNVAKYHVQDTYKLGKLTRLSRPRRAAKC